MRGVRPSILKKIENTIAGLHRSPKLPQKPLCCQYRYDEEKEPTEFYKAGGGGFGEDCGTGVGGGGECLG